MWERKTGLDGFVVDLCTKCVTAWHNTQHATLHNASLLPIYFILLAAQCTPCFLLPRLLHILVFLQCTLQDGHFRFLLFVFTTDSEQERGTVCGVLLLLEKRT